MIIAAAEASCAEAIVVLSGGRHPAPGAARVSEWHDPDRFMAGLDLYRAGKAPRLLFTGGASPFSNRAFPPKNAQLCSIAVPGSNSSRHNRDG
ncbi:MAG: hypothetical protein AB8A39_07525 [Prochlorococcus sp.]